MIDRNKLTLILARLTNTDPPIPYVALGRDPRGFDCIGLVLWVYRELGFNLPDPVPGTADEVFANDIARYFAEVQQPADGDVAGFYAEGQSHAGIYYDKRILHATKRRGVQMIYRRGLQVTGYYRLKPEALC